MYHHFATKLMRELANLKLDFKNKIQAMLCQYDSTDTRATSLDSREEHLNDDARRFLS